MAQADSVSPSAPVPRPMRASSPRAGLLLAVMIGLVVFVVSQVRMLWTEWSELRSDMAVVRKTAVIGYQNIHPNPSYARSPADWFHHEGDFTLLWACWDGGDHRWFRVGRGDVERDRISYPIGRDVIQAIDYPLTENGGGTIWGRIPNEAPVAGFDLAGTEAVYPMQVLEKVLVVNDLIGDRPFLVMFNPVSSLDGQVHIYEPVVDGRRVTLGMSGYFRDQQPVFYDRGTESLWVESHAGVLESIAGQHKGARLQSIENHKPVAWGDWRGRHPASRLVTGADRSRSIPAF